MPSGAKRLSKNCGRSTKAKPDVARWNEKNSVLPHGSKKYQNYLRPILTKLEALPANEFQPNLELLEQLIQSLEVQNQ